METGSVTIAVPLQGLVQLLGLTGT